jgi:hypothetical protein
VTTQLAIAAIFVIVWLALIVGVVGFISLRLRKRALRRGTWPVRLIPWYLGGTPEMPLDAPPESARAQRREAKARR